MVDDVIGMAPDNHGTVLVGPACQTRPYHLRGGAMAAERPGSVHRRTQQRSATFAGILRYRIFSNTDDVVVPHSSSALKAGPGQVTTVHHRSVRSTSSIC